VIDRFIRSSQPFLPFSLIEIDSMREESMIPNSPSGLQHIIDGGRWPFQTGAEIAYSPGFPCSFLSVVVGQTRAWAE
jgi:hypothetical protein